MGMKDFHTRELSNEGIKIPLYHPHTKKKSEDWIVIRGTDSDDFRLADLRAKRQMVHIVAMEEPARSQAHLENTRRLMASLVCSWSFPEECTFENVMIFLENAPQVGDVINQMATQRELFFKKGSDSSVNTPEPTSN